MINIVFRANAKARAYFLYGALLLGAYQALLPPANALPQAIVPEEPALDAAPTSHAPIVNASPTASASSPETAPAPLPPADQAGPINHPSAAQPIDSAPHPDASANGASDQRAAEFIEPSNSQVQQLPFAAPTLRTAASRSQRLARHSQIVHSKVLAWLDLPYAQSTGFRPVTLDLFVPNNSVKADANLPLLIVLHEGDPQHFHSQYNRHFEDTAALFANIAATGVTVTAINYRSPRETNINGQVNDLRAAIRWLELNGEDYRLGKQFALWSFSQSAEIVQAYLLHQQQINSSGTDAKLNAETLTLTAVAMWQPALLHRELTGVPLLAITTDAESEPLPANQTALRYRSFDRDENAANSANTVDPRLDALSRTLQFLLQPKP